MAPGIFRKIFDKVKGFFNGGDDSQASNLVDRIKEKVTQVSDGARHVIDKVNDTIDYAEPVVRKGIRKASEVLDFAEPIVEQAQRIVRKTRRVAPSSSRSLEVRKPPPRIVEVEEFESDEEPPPPPPPKRTSTKIVPRTFKPYKIPEPDDEDLDDRDLEPASIRKQTSKFDRTSTKPKLRPILKPKFTNRTQAESD
jgi:hypothetical protein